MRRSTAAAVGTLTGAALIVGVRLSVSVPAVVVAPPVVDLSGANQSAKPTKKPADKKKEPTKEPADDGGAAASDTGLKDGIYKGKSANYAYGAIQVSIKITDGKIADIKVTPEATNGTSRGFQAKFASGISDEVVGKSLDELDVSKVSGSSLTSQGFNQAIEQIKADATA